MHSFCMIFGWHNLYLRNFSFKSKTNWKFIKFIHYFLFRPLFSVYCRNREIFSFIFLEKLKTGNFSFCSTGDILFTASQRRAKVQIKKLTLMILLFKSWYFTTFVGNSRFFSSDKSPSLATAEHYWAWKKQKSCFLLSRSSTNRSASLSGCLSVQLMSYCLQNKCNRWLRTVWYIYE